MQKYVFLYRQFPKGVFEVCSPFVCNLILRIKRIVGYRGGLTFVYRLFVKVCYTYSRLASIVDNCKRIQGRTGKGKKNVTERFGN